MKYILTILIFISTNASAKTWYIPNGTQPNFNSYAANDNVLFERNGSWLCPNQSHGWQINKTLTIGAYGIGSAPNFQFPNPTNAGVQDREIFYIQGNNVVIRDLDFTDKRFPVNDKQNPAWCSEAARLHGNGNKFINNTVSNIGNGVVIEGNNNVVDSCSFTNLKTIVTGNESDYGANPVTITGNRNIITHNYMVGGWSESLFFGYNGGAIEMYGSCFGNKIMYNYSNDCEGFAEFGSSGGSVIDSTLIAYNIIINNGMVSYSNIDGNFATTCKNTQYLNNTIIENNNSRYSGTGSLVGQGTRKFEGVRQWIFLFNGSPKNNVYILKNNIFWVTTGMTIGASGNKIEHIYNIYKSSPTGYALNSNEINTTASLFDANYYLTSNSQAINFGTPVGLSVDYKGNAITGNPDAGYLEYVGILPIDTTVITPPVQEPLKIRYNNGVIMFRSTIVAPWTLYDTIGRVVMKGIYNAGSVRINIRNLARGIYIFKTQDKNGYITKKIVKN